jgi:hypothetical protein
MRLLQCYSKSILMYYVKYLMKGSSEKAKGTYFYCFNIYRAPKNMFLFIKEKAFVVN